MWLNNVCRTNGRCTSTHVGSQLNQKLNSGSVYPLMIYRCVLLCCECSHLTLFLLVLPAVDQIRAERDAKKKTCCYYFQRRSNMTRDFFVGMVTFVFPLLRRKYIKKIM